jgi:uncharacterized membrane protein
MISDELNKQSEMAEFQKKMKNLVKAIDVETKGKVQAISKKLREFERRNKDFEKKMEDSDSAVKCVKEFVDTTNTKFATLNDQFSEMTTTIKNIQDELEKQSVLNKEFVNLLDELKVCQNNIIETQKVMSEVIEKNVQSTNDCWKALHEYIKQNEEEKRNKKNWTQKIFG